MQKGSLQLVLCAALALTAAGAAQAQPAWPTQRVTLVNPLQPGGAIDLVARAIAPHLEQRWKQPVIVENRPGGGMMVAANYVAKSPPDGHILVLTGDMRGPRLFMKVEFAESDLKPAVELVRGGWLAVINAGIPAKTLAEFIAYAKTRPGALNYGTIANTTFDLDYIDFAQKAGIQMTAVPYQGTPAAATAVATNELQFFFGVPATVAPHIASGRMTVLAATTPQRLQQHPNVPTVRELGIDYDGGYNFGLYAQGGTPDGIIARIAADAGAVVKIPEVAARFREMGFESSGLAGLAWAAEQDRKNRIYTDIARRIGLKPPQ